MNLYLTADVVGTQTGGGSVTRHESEALSELDTTQVISRNVLSLSNDPFEQDDAFYDEISKRAIQDNYYGLLKLAHCYSGCLSNAVEGLLCMGVKVAYTAAAHDLEVSQREHLAIGLPYNFPHLTDPELWRRYVGGYLFADVLVCPSNHSAEVMRKFGAKQRIEVIPHGVDIPSTDPKPLPDTFRVGYLGAYGGDKGVRYLLEAWKKLNYPDAELWLGGKDSQHPFVLYMCNKYGGGRIYLKGWIENLEDFYSNISLYVQPSCTEGFGLEVLESMAHARPVLCSRGAGAVDVVLPHWDFEACNSDALAEQIDGLKKESWCLGCVGLSARRVSKIAPLPSLTTTSAACKANAIGVV